MECQIKSRLLQFKDSLLTTGFAFNLEYIILKYQPDIWFHGHVHDSVDYFIGKTRIVCNPTGYPHEKGNGFKEKLVIGI